MNRQTLFDLLICAFEGIILFYFADKILERRFKNHVILILSCMLHICTVYMLNSAPIVVKIPVSVMVFLILSILNFSDKITVIAGSTAYAFYIIIASDFIFADLISLFQNTDIYNTIASYDNSTVFFAFAIKMINFTLYSLSIKNFKKINKNSNTFSIITLDIIFICFLLISSVLVVLYPTVTYDPKQMTLFFILSIIFFITNFLILNLYVKLCDYFEKEQYWAVSDIKYKALKNQIELQNEFIETTNKFRHDMKKILETVSYFNEQDQHKELADFLNGLSVDKYSHEAVLYCKDQFINAVLNIKAKECENKGIAMKIRVSPILGYSAKPDDMVLILSNILDNAIEAAEKSFEKNVEIKIYNYAENLIIYSENTYLQKINGKNFFKTDKKISDIHGYGIKIITELVNSNCGNISFEHDNGIFKVTIMLPDN